MGPTMERWSNSREVLSYWSERGLPKEKIVMGAPFYRSDPEICPISKLCKPTQTAAQTDIFDYYGTTYHYNGIPTIQTKTRIAMEKAGGMMFWALDHDAQGELSLVNAIYQAAHPSP